MDQQTASPRVPDSAQAHRVDTVSRESFAAANSLVRERGTQSPVSFWDSLNASERNALESIADERVFAKGARIIYAGEHVDYVIVVLAGWVKISTDDIGEGKVSYRGPGQLIGENAVLRVNVRSANVDTLQVLHALVIKSDQFVAFLGSKNAAILVERRREQGVLPNSMPCSQANVSQREPRSRISGYDFGHPTSLAGENCTVVYSDVVAFSSPLRSDEHRRMIRRTVATITATSLRRMWTRCIYGDRGDGLLVVVPPNSSTLEILECLLIALPTELRRHNNLYADGARIQLRVAIDVGPVTTDELGVTGKVIINAARLLDAPPFKEAMAAQQAQLGLVVSDFVYQSAVRQADYITNPNSYAEIDAEVKGTPLRAWMLLVEPPFGTLDHTD